MEVSLAYKFPCRNQSCADVEFSLHVLLISLLAMKPFYEPNSVLHSNFI